MVAGKLLDKVPVLSAQEEHFSYHSLGLEVLQHVLFI
jgi:hypothetical protein